MARHTSATASLSESNQKLKNLSHPPLFDTVPSKSFNTDPFSFLSRGHVCANAPLYPLIGQSSVKPRLPHTGLQQRYSGSPSRHVWRQMESESVSGLPEMSFTSAAHKESGHRRSRITRWKRGVSKKTRLNFNLCDPEVKESGAAGQKSQRDRSGCDGNERNHAKKEVQFMRSDLDVTRRCFSQVCF